MRTIQLLIAFSCAAGVAHAQTVINGGRTVTGSWDASQATASKPARMGAALPTSCGTGEFFFLSSAVAGKNLYLCTSGNIWTQTAGAAPAAASGSGTASVLGGATSSAPACGSATAGTLFFADDSPYETWCNGTNWRYRFNGAPANPADDSTFSWVNQGGASVNVSGGMTPAVGVVGLTAPAGGCGFNPRIRAVTSTSTAFTLTAVLAPTSLTTAGNTQGGIGLVAYNSSYFVTCEFRLSGLPAVATLHTAIYSSSFPSPSQIVGPTYIAQWFPGSPLWLRLQTSDSATFNASISTDHGANWQPIGAVAFGGAQAFPKLGWFVSSDTSDQPLTGSLLSWSLTTP